MSLIKVKASEIERYLKDISNRMQFDSPYERSVAEIIKDVKERGDNALVGFVKKFDGILLKPEEFKLAQKKWEEGAPSIDKKLKNVIDMAAERLEKYYSRVSFNSWFSYDKYNNLLGTKIVPLQRVLVYAPGGKATYPSSVLMGAIPAKIAGVNEIILTSPAKDGYISPTVLYAAKRAGVSSIYCLGGAHAIAAFAFGTKTIPRVDKIVGPGNIYVAIAKKQLFGYVDIDMVAGPSEVLVIFDSNANIEHIAYDMLSQLEHDEQAMAIAITNDIDLAKKLEKTMISLVKKSERKAIIDKSLRNSAIFVVKDLYKAVELANHIAPEHLEICTEKPFELLPYITSAGAVFLGNNTPEAVGDYMAGPNHILPTGGTARFFSPLGVEDFIKRMSVISFTKEGLDALGEGVSYFAKSEGLYAHAKSVEVRLKKKKEKR